MHDAIPATPDFLAQVTAFLESPYKPFLMYLPFLPWAWLVSSRLDKDARYFHLKVGTWNAIHLAGGAAALLAMLFIPIFWIGWPVGILLLATPIVAYWQFRNQNVPEAQQFHLSALKFGNQLDARRKAKAKRDALIHFVDAKGAMRDVPPKEDPAYQVHMAAEDLVGLALDDRATSLELNLQKQGCAVAQSVDGIRYKRETLPPDVGLRAIDFFKGLAGLDVEDRRRRQNGAFAMQSPRGRTDLLVATAGSSAGLVLRMEFDRGKQLSRPFDSLGLLPSQKEALAAITEAHDRHGIVLVGAPPGNGLRTTMYSLVARHDAFTSNIKSLEREILLHVDGVDHVRWDPNKPEVDYASHLQSILRRDPDIVLLSPPVDAAAARVAAEPGRQGPLMYVPLRQATIAEQVLAWVKLVGDVKKATAGLRVVMNQRLMRSLCANCRQSYQPTPEQLKKLNLSSRKVTQLYRAGGKVQVKNRIEPCPVCGGRGYLGQLGIFEVFAVDSDARKHLAAGDLKAALGHARRNKMIFLQEAALAKVAAGETTVEEVVRVTAPAREASGGSPPPQREAAPAT